MKILVISIWLLCLAMVNPGFAQIPNNGFESWTGVGNYVVPDGWGTLNPVTSPANVFTCIKGTPGNPGTAFLRLVSKSVPGMGMKPGVAVSGTLNATTYKAETGFPFYNRPVNLKGNWQFMAYGADQGYMAVYLTRWNAGISQRDTVGKLVYWLPGMVMSWQQFTLPITYFSSEFPDTAMIVLSSSGANPVSPSYLFIDNLSFHGGTVGFENISGNGGVLIFPNPVTGDKLTVENVNSVKNPEGLDIFDIKGNLVKREALLNRHFPLSIDVSELKPGEYLLRINSAEESSVGRFIRH